MKSMRHKGTYIQKCPVSWGQASKQGNPNLLVKRGRGVEETVKLRFSHHIVFDYDKTH